MNLSNYWQLPQTQREQTRESVHEQDLQAFALAQKLLIYDGKLYKPEDYPCACELEDPTLCYEDQPERSWTQQEQEEGQCHCPCHCYFAPW